MRSYVIVFGVALLLIGDCGAAFADRQRAPNSPTLSSVASTAPCAAPPVCSLSYLPFISDKLSLLLTSYNFEPTKPKKVAQGFLCSHTGHAAEGAAGQFKVTIDYVCDPNRGWQHRAHAVAASFTSAPNANPNVTIVAQEQAEYVGNTLNQVGRSFFDAQLKETTRRADMSADLKTRGGQMEVDTTVSQETFALHAYEQAPGQFELASDIRKIEQRFYANDTLASNEFSYRTSRNKRSDFSLQRDEYLADGQLLEATVHFGWRMGNNEFSYFRSHRPFIHDLQREVLEISASDDGVTQVIKNPQGEVSTASLKNEGLTVPLSEQDAAQLSTYIDAQRQQESSWGLRPFPDLAL